MENSSKSLPVQKKDGKIYIVKIVDKVPEKVEREFTHRAVGIIQ